MREFSVREANQNFSQVIAAAERGKTTIVVTKNGRSVAKVSLQSEDRASDPERRASFAALEENLRSKRGSGRRVGTIAEDDKYCDHPA